MINRLLLWLMNIRITKGQLALSGIVLIISGVSGIFHLFHYILHG